MKKNITIKYSTIQVMRQLKNINKTIAGLILPVAFLFCVSAVQAQIPAPPQDRPVALEGGTVHTISNGVIENGTVVFEDGKITAVGTDVDIPAGADVVDVSGRHVYPGLIHASTTLGLSEIGRVGETVDLNEHGDINPNVRAEVAFHPESEHIPTAAVNGITTVISTPTGGLISGMPAAMMTNGWTWEQMTLEAPVGMVINWPNMGRRDTRDENIEKLQNFFDDARMYQTVKKAAGEEGVPRHLHDVRLEAMIPVLEGELPVFINASELRQIQAAIAWAEKEDLRMVLVGGRDAGYVADQLAERDIPVILTPVISGPSRSWEGYDASYTTPLELYEAGVDFCIGGESSAAYAYRLMHHAGSAVAFGLSKEKGIKSLTLDAARILGIDDKVGSIEEGKDATLIVTNGNPLELWTRVEQVYIQGREDDMMDKQRRLYEKYKEKQRQAER